MTLKPEEYKLTPEQQLSYDELQGSFYHFHRQYPSLSYYGNIPAQYSENTVSWIQWIHWIEGWIKTINDNQEKLNEDFNDFVDQFNKFIDYLPDEIINVINSRVNVNTTNSIKMNKKISGSPSLIDISSDIRLSKVKHDFNNVLTIDDGTDGGLYAPDYRFETINLASTPTFFGDMDGVQQNVSQSFMMSSKNYILNVQSGVNNPPDSDRHATINFLNKAGLVISTMEILHSGHGTNWNLIEDNSSGTLQYKILMVSEIDTIKRPFIFNYQPNGRIDLKTETNLTELKNSNNEDIIIAIDNKRNELITYQSTSDNKILIKEYNETEFLVHGTDAEIINQFYITSPITTMQGVAIRDRLVYVYNSTISNLEENDAKVITHDIDTSEEIEYKLGRIGQDPQITENQYIEGEGIYIWESPQNKISIFISVATGFAGGSKRVAKLYGWHEYDNKRIFQNIINEKTNFQKDYDSDGTAKTLEILPATLLEIDQIGTFYFNGSQIQSFSDYPKNYGLGSSGYYLINTPKNKGRNFIQRLVRNNSSDQSEYQRTVDGRNKIAGDWVANESYTSRLIKPIAPLTTLASLTAKGEYYLNTEEWHNLTDVPTDPNLGYGTSGFYVTISKNTGDGSVKQECFRNTTTENPVMLIRSVLGGTTASQWLIIKNI